MGELKIAIANELFFCSWRDFVFAFPESLASTIPDLNVPIELRVLPFLPDDTSRMNEHSIFRNLDCRWTQNVLEILGQEYQKHRVGLNKTSIFKITIGTNLDVHTYI
jgi:hypothetical protein